LADRIRPKGPEDRDESDLVRFRDADLYGLLWDVEFDDDGPIVLIERNAGGAQRLGRNDEFIAAVYPEILRRALDRALIEEKATHDDPEHWLSLWYKGYLKPKLGMEPPESAEQDGARREWIGNAVRAFARHFQIAQRWPIVEESQTGGNT
jgi:hypothetical protein